MTKSTQERENIIFNIGPMGDEEIQQPIAKFIMSEYGKVNGKKKNLGNLFAKNSQNREEEIYPCL